MCVGALELEGAASLVRLGCYEAARVPSIRPASGRFHFFVKRANFAENHARRTGGIYSNRTGGIAIVVDILVIPQVRSH
jgi:hypothetical protein